MKPSPYQISAFTEVARQRSFSRAAQVLGVTQSSITQHIANLEQLMGTSLFIRRRDGVELTANAEELYAVSNEMRSLEQRVHEMVAQYGTLSAGKLKVVSDAPRPALPLLAKYARQYPQVDIDFVVRDWTAVMEQIQSREADIAILADPLNIGGTQVMELAEMRCVAHLPGSHPLASSPELSLAQLADVTLVLPQEGSLVCAHVMETVEKHGIKLGRVVRTSATSALDEAVLQGIGVAVFLEGALFDLAGLVTRPIVEMSRTYRQCLVTPRDKGKLRLVQSFVEIVESEQARS